MFPPNVLWSMLVDPSEQIMHMRETSMLLVGMKLIFERVGARYVS